MRNFKKSNDIRKSIYEDVMNGLSKSLRPILEKELSDDDMRTKHDELRNRFKYHSLKTSYRIIPILDPKKSRVQNNYSILPKTKEEFKKQLPFYTYYICTQKDFYELYSEDEGYSSSLYYIIVDNFDKDNIQIRNRDAVLVDIDNFERTTGISIYEFEPNDSETLHQLGIKTLDDVEQMLEDGKDLKLVFDEFKPFGNHRDTYIVRIGQRYNILVDDELVFDSWFTWITDMLNKNNLGDEYKNFQGWDDKGRQYHYKIHTNEGYNYMNDEFDLLFDNDVVDIYCTPLSGYYAVEYEPHRNYSDERYYIVDSEEHKISNEKFHHIKTGSKTLQKYGLIEVERLDNKKHSIYNLMDTDGNFLSNAWFSSSDILNSKYIELYVERGSIFINPETKEQLNNNPMQTIGGYSFKKPNYVPVTIPNRGKEAKYNIMSLENGEMLGERPFDEIKCVDDDVFEVRMNKKTNFFNINNGEFMFNNWIDRIDNPDRYGRRCIFIGNSYNYIDKNLKLTGEWQMVDGGYNTEGNTPRLEDFDEHEKVLYSKFPLYIVKKGNNKYYIYDENTKSFINDEPFEECEEIITYGYEYDVWKYELFIVKIDGEYNIYDISHTKNPHLMFSNGFDEIYNDEREMHELMFKMRDSEFEDEDENDDFDEFENMPRNKRNKRCRGMRCFGFIEDMIAIAVDGNKKYFVSPNGGLHDIKTLKLDLSAMKKHVNK